MNNRFKQTEKVACRLGLNRHDPTLVISIPESTGSKFKLIVFCRMSSLDKAYEQYKNEMEIWWFEEHRDKIEKRYGKEFTDKLITKDSRDKQLT